VVYKDLRLLIMGCFIFESNLVMVSIIVYLEVVFVYTGTYVQGKKIYCLVITWVQRWIIWTDSMVTPRCAMSTQVGFIFFEVFIMGLQWWY